MKLVSFGEDARPGRIDGEEIRVLDVPDVRTYFERGCADETGESVPLEGRRLRPPICRRSSSTGAGVSRPAAGAVVEADLQRDREHDRGADRPAARVVVRGGGRGDRPRAARLRPDGRGQGGRGGGGCRAARGSVGDERPRRSPGGDGGRGRSLRAVPSMLDDVHSPRPTEVDFISGSLVREAEHAGVPVPLHTAMYRLVKAREEAFS